MKEKQAPARRSESSPSYEGLERGSLTPQEARQFVAGLLEAGPSGEIAEDLYESLRVLTGRMLRDKSDADFLRAWYAVIDAASAQFDELEEPWAARIEVLAELLSDRIGLVESRPAHEVLQRRHAAELLELLNARIGGIVKRSELRDQLGLEEANLSRILGLLVDTGLVERSRLGKEALFSISSSGCEALLDLNDRIGMAVDVCGSWTETFGLGAALVEPGSIGRYGEFLVSDETLGLEGSIFTDDLLERAA